MSSISKFSAAKKNRPEFLRRILANPRISKPGRGVKTKQDGFTLAQPCKRHEYSKVCWLEELDGRLYLHFRSNSDDVSALEFCHEFDAWYSGNGWLNAAAAPRPVNHMNEKRVAAMQAAIAQGMALSQGIHPDADLGRFLKAVLG